MSREILLTPEGHAKLAAELQQLKGPVRMRIADAIREAKSHGDLKENAAYHEAKLNQQRNESRVAELENVLQSAKIIERTTHDTSDAALGSKVKLLDLEFDEEFDVELVGSFEGDPATDKISITSPLGSALMGQLKGAEVVVDAPAGTQRYRILEIS